MSEKKGILSHGGSSHQAHVKIIAEEKVQNPSPASPPPSPSAVNHYLSNFNYNFYLIINKLLSVLICKTIKYLILYIL